jgi:site-specific recombinase XerD
MKSKLTEDGFSESSYEMKYINAAINAHTRRARRIDMIDFVSTFSDEDSNGKPSGQSPAMELIRQPPEGANAMLLQYHAKLVKRNLAVSTINRRLATIRAWVRFAQKEMLTGLSPDQLIGELVNDNESRERSLDSITLSQLCALPDISTQRGLRDIAILQLICEVPLLSWQICSLRVEDVSPSSGQLRIPIVNIDASLNEHKKTSEKIRDESTFVPVNVSPETLQRIREYLSQNQLQDRKDSPLFINFDRCPSHTGKNLVPKSILYLVKEYGNEIGVQHLNPRTIRVSAVIRTLEEANWKTSIAHRRFPHVGLHTWFRYARDH